MTVGVGAVSDPVAGCGLKDPIRWIWAAVTGVTAHVSCDGNDRGPDELRAGL